MVKHIEVIYTHGVFRPAAPLELPLEEGQHLTFMLPEHDAEVRALRRGRRLETVVCRAGRRAGTELRGRAADAVQNSRVHGGRGDCRAR